MEDRELLQAIYTELKGMRSEMDDMHGELKGMRSEMDDMHGELRGMRNEMDTMHSEIGDIQRGMTDLQKRVTNVEMTLENEVNRNIRIIAEGHLDLNRKLDEALKAERDREMQKLRLNTLENEVRQLKETVGQIA